MSAQTKIICPLCQYQVDDRAACHGCGLTTHCTMIKCPNCEYEFVENSRVMNLFHKVGVRLRAWFRGNNFSKGALK